MGVSPSCVFVTDARTPVALGEEKSLEQSVDVLSRSIVEAPMAQHVGSHLRCRIGSCSYIEMAHFSLFNANRFPRTLILGLFVLKGVGGTGA